MNKQETLEEVRVIKRTELYKSILSIVKQIPRKEVEEDAMDAPSCAYGLEQLFLKWQAERMYSEKESIQKIIDYVDFQFNTNGELNSEIKKWFNKFKKK